MKNPEFNPSFHALNEESVEPGIPLSSSPAALPAASAGEQNYNHYIGSLYPSSDSQSPGILPLLPSQENADKKELNPFAVPPAEAKLLNDFAALVEGLSFPDLAVPSGHRPITQIEKFSFLSITANIKSDSSQYAAGYNVSIKEGVRKTYRDVGNPYIDTSQAIGLVYGDWLVAVAAASIDRRELLTIVQLQDVSSVRKATDGSKYYKTGLHNGILWRDTLVRAWEELAEQLGASGVAIQSNSNNRWHINVLGKGYDDVAQRMGYILDSKTRDWIKP